MNTNPTKTRQLSYNSLIYQKETIMIELPYNLPTRNKQAFGSNGHQLWLEGKQSKIFLCKNIKKIKKILNLNKSIYM